MAARDAPERSEGVYIMKLATSLQQGNSTRDLCRRKIQYLTIKRDTYVTIIYCPYAKKSPIICSISA